SRGTGANDRVASDAPGIDRERVEIDRARADLRPIRAVASGEENARPPLAAVDSERKRAVAADPLRKGGPRRRRKDASARLPRQHAATSRFTFAMPIIASTRMAGRANGELIQVVVMEQPHPARRGALAPIEDRCRIGVVEIGPLVLLVGV